MAGVKQLILTCVLVVALPASCLIVRPRRQGPLRCRSGAGDGALPEVSVPELRRLVEVDESERDITITPTFQKRAAHLKKREFAMVFALPSGERRTFMKRRGESILHVLMKALLFAAYEHRFPGVEIERDLRDRYVPDLVAVDGEGNVLFWGECGKTDLKKIHSVAQRFPSAELAVAKWDVRLQGYEPTVRRALQGPPQARGRVTLHSFPDDSLDRYFTDDGVIVLPDGDDAAQRRAVRFDS